ncbi:MAG TPA: regulatory protein RecX [Pseudolysinimonas sp.]|nr:regulatory protein RecX [Pseudolysinimonas sp.]
MERSDAVPEGLPQEGGARLAPVTYLPGVQPPDRSAHPSSARPASARPSSGAPAGIVRPSFAAMYNEEPDEPAAAGAGIADEPAEPDKPEEPEEPDELPRDRDGDLARAENVSMHALTRRGQSRRELERTLRSRDLPDDVISHEIERLERVGLIDDVALAQNLVGVLQERKGLGRTGIASELTRRLLSPAAIEYALELVDTGEELARARELAVKRAGQLTSYDRVTAERRLSGFLARRGYSGSTVRAAVEHALSGRQSAASKSGGVRFR